MVEYEKQIEGYWNGMKKAYMEMQRTIQNLQESSQYLVDVMMREYGDDKKAKIQAYENGVFRAYLEMGRSSGILDELHQYLGDLFLEKGDEGSVKGGKK